MPLDIELLLLSLAIGGIGGMVRLALITEPTRSEAIAILITTLINTAVFFLIAPSDASQEVRIAWYIALFTAHIGITLERAMIRLFDNLRDRREEWRTHGRNLEERLGS